VPRTVLIDYARESLTPALFPALAARMAQLAAEVGASIGQSGLDELLPHDGMICVSELVRHADAAGLRAGNGDLMLSPAVREALLLTASTEIGTNAVKVSSLAEETARHIPNPLVEIRTDAARGGPADCALLGVIGTLPSSMWPRELRAWSPWT
jgi:hypothetical protein